MQGASVSPITELEEYTGYDADVMNMVKAKVLTNSENEVSNSSRYKMMF